jgi:4'-phosphopantetheinyl transferase
MIQLYFMDLDGPLDPGRYLAMFSLLPADRQQKISGFRCEADRRLHVFSEVLVRCLACRELHLHHEELCFGQNAFGKPYLLHSPSFHYNISHTRNALAVGISDEPIGVDTEKVKDADIRIAKRVFTENECSRVCMIQQNQDKLFYEVWTKKEAYLKWTGQGFHMDPGLLDVLTMQGLEKKAHLFTADINTYIVSVCTRIDPKRIETVNIDEPTLLKMAMHFMQ